jgi:hypothetical protein
MGFCIEVFQQKAISFFGTPPQIVIMMENSITILSLMSVSLMVWMMMDVSEFFILVIDLNPVFIGSICIFFNLLFIRKKYRTIIGFLIVISSVLHPTNPHTDTQQPNSSLALALSFNAPELSSKNDLIV